MWCVLCEHDDVIALQVFGPFVRGSDAAACKYRIDQHDGWSAHLYEVHSDDAIEQVLAEVMADGDAEWLRSRGF